MRNAIGESPFCSDRDAGVKPTRGRRPSKWYAEAETLRVGRPRWCTRRQNGQPHINNRSQSSGGQSGPLLYELQMATDAESGGSEGGDANLGTVLVPAGPRSTDSEAGHLMNGIEKGE